MISFNNFVKYLAVISFVIILVFSNSSIADDSMPDVLIKPFPILSWVPPQVSQQQLNWYDEAGFTVLTMYPDEDKYEVMKKYWDGNYIVFKEWSEFDYDDMLAFHPEDDKKIGYLLGDEPLYDGLAEYKVIADKMREADPQRICLVNLFPSYVGETRLGNGFLDYIKDSFELINPRYCSLDNYPLMWFDVERPEYYYDIEMLRKFSQWNDSKQIGFIQLYSSSVCRDVSESDVAWQVNTLLAYGCKGLWYFNFRHPSAGDSKAKMPEISEAGAKDFRNLPGQWAEYYKPVYENFGGSSALGMDDKPSFSFEYVKKANAQALAWGPLLLTLENNAVRHVVNRQPFAPVGTEVFAEARFISEANEPFINSVKAVDPDKDKGFIISYFENEAKDSYVMIVNKNHGEFITCKGGAAKTKIVFDEEVAGIKIVSPVDGTLEDKKITDRLLTVDIEAGGAILFKVECK
ncbi:MAG: hypothetical protein ACIAQZ_07530 [Sedimentisphaeraceae bacterium JB056]